MTIIRTYRPESPAVPFSERIFESAEYAEAWGEFMALAGYVVEMEGTR